MPYLGLLPFLQMKVITLNVMKHCVNALSRASPISTIHADFHWGGILVCQCPISGFSHFYDYISSELQRSQNCVNALSRASPISTHTIRHFHFTKMCVNALSRASPISTSFLFYQTFAWLIVSMPYLGLLPFLPIIKEYRNPSFLVSMPYLGLLPFLRN